MRHGATLALVPLWLGIAFVPALAAGWSLPDDSQGLRIAPLLLLSRPDIRADLGLAPEQVAEVEKAVDGLHREASALRGRTDEAAKAERRAVDDRQRSWLVSKLTVEQRERLAQLDLRWEGPAAMTTRPSVAEALVLSDEQRAALARAVAECDARRRMGTDPAGAEARHAAEALGVLSDGQKQRWERMLGRPFAVKPMATAAR